MKVRGLKSAGVLPLKCAYMQVPAGRLLFSLVLLSFMVILLPQLVVGSEYRERNVRVAVQAYNGVALARRKWGPTVDYLNRKISGATFELVPLVGFAELRQVIARGEAEFVLTNPTVYVDLEINHNASRIATLVNKSGEQPTKEFGSVIFTLAARDDIRNLNDLRGKIIMGVDPESLGGWLMSWRELLDHGLDPFKNCRQLLFAGTQEPVVMAVREQQVDVGVVRTGIMEEMAARGEVSLSDFKVIAPIKDDFPYPHSTRLYPEWPFAKASHTSDTLASQVVVALLSLPPDDPAAIAGHYYGWTVPLDYGRVHEILKVLRTGPYRDFGRVTLKGVLRTYWPWLTGFFILTLAGFFLSLRIYYLNRKLSHSRSLLQAAHRDLEKQVAERTRQLREEIAERLAAEAHLQKSEKKYRSIFENMQNAYFLATMDGEVQLVNPGAVKLLGYKNSAAIIGKNMARDLYADHKQLSILLEKLKTDGTAASFPLTFKRVDGKLVETECNVHLIYDDGIPIAVEGLAQDVTHHREAENKLQRYKDGLEKRVVERTAELDDARQALLNLVEDLNAANQQLQELDRLKSMFIASMSHELRTPLNSVIGFSSILLDEWLGPLNEEQKLNMDAILRSGKHLLSLINDVIDISKVEAGTIEPHIEDFDLQEVMQEALEALKGEAESKGLTLQLEDFPQMVRSDRRRLLQILLNLLSNGIKFTHHGSVSLAARLLDDQEKVEIRVSDTGIGISEEDMGKLFQPFSRIHDVGQSEYPGTGLGLYLCKKIAAEILGGIITVKSTVGKGSVFSVIIPVRVEG